MDYAGKLREAALILEKFGHCKHTLRDPRDGSSCIMGAINCAVHNSINRPGYEDNIGEKVGTLVADHLGLPVGSPAGFYKLEALVRWNNHPDRQADEVIKALRDTADAISKDSQ